MLCVFLMSDVPLTQLVVDTALTEGLTIKLVSEPKAAIEEKRLAALRRSLIPAVESSARPIKPWPPAVPLFLWISAEPKIGISGPRTSAGP